MYVVNVDALCGVFRDHYFGDSRGLVSRVVEHLNLELVARVVDCSYRFEQTIDDVQFIEKRELNGNQGQIGLGKSRARVRYETAITPEIDDLFDAVRAVDRERSEDGK